MMSEILFAVFGGGATGLLGSVIGRFTTIWEMQQERRFVLDKYKLDAQIRSSEMESEYVMAENRLASADLSASYKHDSKLLVSSELVQSIRALVRPALTGFLWLLVGIIWFTLPDFSENRAEVVQSILYAATTATVWWFGDRSCQKRGVV